MTIEEALTEIKERVRVTEYVDSDYVDSVDIEALRVAIKSLEQPPTQSDRKRGKWMLADMYESTHKAMMCDKCNAAYDMTIAGGMFNFCPNCGADMRGEKDERSD